MATRRHPHVINVDELQWQASSEGERFASARKRLGGEVGGRELGCTVFETPPGKAAFPFHAHGANEEAIYILSGEGTLRLGDDRVAVRAGDYIAFPATLQLAHQLINSGAETLRYLCISTMILPEVLRYPDSNKLGVMIGKDGAPESWPELRGRAFKLLRDEASLGYYDGE